MKSIAITLILASICSSCYEPEGTEVKPTRKVDRPPVTEQSGGFGSQVDPTRKPTHGEAVVTEDTYLGLRQTDRNNIILATVVSSPERSEVDTFEIRLATGKNIMRVKKGTRVTLRDIVPVTVDGEVYRFRKVEIADGSLNDKNGDPVRGSILEKYLKR
jgi:hypothetical protein